MTKKIINDEDRDLFRQSVGDIRPLTADKVLPPTDKPKPFPKPKTSSDNGYDHVLASSVGELATLGQEDSLSFARPGASKNVLKKLRQGYLGMDAELDLHGLTSQEAQRQLLRFLNLCNQRNYRCVRIVHGKGYRSVDRLPVLKNDINYWLRQHKQVLAFCSAAPRDGGTGAVWVLLKESAIPP